MGKESAPGTILPALKHEGLACGEKVGVAFKPNSAPAPNSTLLARSDVSAIQLLHQIFDERKRRWRWSLVV